MFFKNPDYNTPPAWAVREIKDGPLAGLSNIDPIWRLSVFDEAFGPAGTGWKYVVTEKQFVPGANGEIVLFVAIDFLYRDEGEWADPVPGFGGAKFIELRNGVLVTNDEALKAAVTDALSVVGKQLGIGANVYAGAFDTKYIRGKGKVKTEAKTEAKQVIEIKAEKTEKTDKTEPVPATGTGDKTFEHETELRELVKKFAKANGLKGKDAILPALEAEVGMGLAFAENKNTYLKYLRKRFG